jgi:N-acetylglucosaminyldiphosphoundecaprenol N-acetyl-beta-D-mannosaminyltransferase
MSGTVEARVVPCAGVPVTHCTLDEATDLVIELAQRETAEGSHVHLCNAYTIALADQDPELKRLLGDSTLNFADGMSVVWANRWRNRKLELPRERVSGPDLFLRVIERGKAVGLRHYLLGSTPEVLADLEAELRRRFPEIVIVSTDSPPFRALTSDESRDQLRRIRDATPNIVWVGLGTPKQDWVARKLAAEAPGVFIAVGAAFDFTAGHKTRAPNWMQRSGLEWVYRLKLEPRRLWRRYLVGNAGFIRAARRAR